MWETRDVRLLTNSLSRLAWQMRGDMMKHVAFSVLVDIALAELRSERATLGAESTFDILSAVRIPILDELCSFVAATGVSCDMITGSRSLPRLCPRCIVWASLLQTWVLTTLCRHMIEVTSDMAEYMGPS